MNAFDAVILYDLVRRRKAMDEQRESLPFGDDERDVLDASVHQIDRDIAHFQITDKDSK